MSFRQNERDLVNVGVNFLAVVVGALALATLAAVAGFVGQWKPTPGHVLRTLAHMVGIFGGVAIIYFTDDIRRKTRGSAMETSSFVVEMGTVLFVAVFVGMEARHSLGVDIWYFASTPATTQTWWMIALAGVMLSYAVAYRYLVAEVGV